jgi:hypothetical protein
MSTRLTVRDFLNEKERAALGEVAAESAQLESTTETMLKIVLKLTDAEYDAIIGGKMFGAKLDILKEVGLCRLRGKKRKKHKQQFIVLMDHLKSLVGQRNIAIHGNWGPEGGFTLATLATLMDGTYVPRPAAAIHKKGKKTSTLKVARLEHLAAELNEGGSLLWDFAKVTWLKVGLRISGGAFSDTQPK